MGFADKGAALEFKITLSDFEQRQHNLAHQQEIRKQEENQPKIDFSLKNNISIAVNVYLLSLIIFRFLKKIKMVLRNNQALLLLLLQIYSVAMVQCFLHLLLDVTEPEKLQVLSKPRKQVLKQA